MQLIFIWTLLALSSYSVAAQELRPSTTWRSPNITLSKEDRTSIASAALNEAITMLSQSNGQFVNSTYEAGGTLYAQMAEFDRLTSQTTYKDMLKQYFTFAESGNHGFLDVSSLQAGLSYGYAAVRAYTAYRDPDFLTIAATSWASARRYTVSLEQAATGTMETKKFTLASSCNGTTLAGGTYSITDPNDPNLDSLASGMFIVVSALLAEATSNQTYIDAAVESANFIQSHLLTPSNIVWGSIWSTSNESSSLAILARIPHNTSTESLLRGVIFKVATDLLWQGVDGVYNRANSGGHYIVRALASLYERNKTSSDLREYMKEYIGVQYNAVVSSSDNDIYGLPWTAPGGTSFDGVYQTSALTVLLSAIQLVDDQSSPTSSDNPTSSVNPAASVNPDNSGGSASMAKKDLAGIIAGSVVGGVVLLAALMVGTIFLRKRHRQRNDSSALVVDGSSRTPTPTPFTTTQNMASSGISGEQDRKNQANSRFPWVATGDDPSFLGAADNGSVGIVGANVRTEPMASPGAQVTSPENPPPDRGEHTLMEELLRTLNYRISRDRWNGEELPPNYHEG
ncbi:hypothetical protein EDD85DRAFT_1024011 [Armillaria nabsnona]|nr:hypothetical protein EDD85DRAFT_1024011 [Armillaria nabsnona]